MHAAPKSESKATVVRKSDRELEITRTFNGPPHIVYQAWTKPELFRRWWAPKSYGVTILSCEMDVRTGGTYRLTFAGDPDPVAFFGRYVEVIPNARLVWTNEEGGEDGAVTTVTFEDDGGKTRVVVHELHATKESLDTSSFSGVTEGTLEAFDQLEAMLGEGP